MFTHVTCVRSIHVCYSLVNTAIVVNISTNFGTVLNSCQLTSTYVYILRVPDI